MTHNLSKLIREQKFNPGFLGVFINPFYFVRRELFKSTSLLSPHIKGKILDVGCDNKPYQKLFTHAKEYIGLELDSPENRKKGEANVFYDGKHFPFGDSTFDSVVFTQVLEHVFNPDEFLNEINRILKKDGNILLTAPFIWDEHEQPHDYARYSSFGLGHLLKKHGFQIIKSFKMVDDIRVIFQLINCFIYKLLPPVKSYRFRLCLYVLLISPFTILGIFFSLFFPKSRGRDLYMQNVILAQKI